MKTRSYVTIRPMNKNIDTNMIDTNGPGKCMIYGSLTYIEQAEGR